MEVPQMDGLQMGKGIGAGGCGRVYQARDAEGVAVALKVFDERCISRGLLEKMTKRLEAGGWPDGVMPLISFHFGERGIFWVMPLVADADAEAQPRSRSLQMSLDAHPGNDTWKAVGSLARALAGMHRRRVAHGNLKPGNVFFSDDGEVLLSDWAMGNMPGVRQFHFTDAVLYQPPEQLRDPSGYLDEEGYQWDVYAFGALAYRVLTGRFSRCDETFRLVAPPAGVTRKEGLQADLGKVARNLEAAPEVSWPDEAQSPLEEGLRGWIERCLNLDPARRPVSMMEVAAGFEAVEKKLAHEIERESLMDQRRRSERRAWRTLFFAGFASASALVLGGLWHLSTSKLLKERGEHADEVAVLTTVGEAAEVEKFAAIAEMQAARQATKNERDLSLARLEASRLIGDRLFSWAMEKGHRRLPPLDGREIRLKRLEGYFEDFLIGSGGIETLADERARVILQLAEISLAAGDAPSATRRLGEALEAWSNLPMDAEFKLRMASNSLLLALLRQSISDPETQPAFNAARKALEAVPQTEVDADRLNQLLAILDFQEAKVLAASGEDTKALEQLLRATQTLNRIADHRSDAAILRSELAACYLSSATILEGMGSLGDAREVRVLATEVIVKLLKEQPDNPGLRLDLAGCYGAMAEAAMLSGDIPAAESLSNQAIQLLDQLLRAQPDHAEAVARMAAQLGLRAGIHRDRGLAAEAMKGYEEVIRMLEGVRASAPNNAMVSYRLALLWWQKGRMLGMGGNRIDEIVLIRKARELLGTLENAAASSGPRPEQLQSAGAYLLGDLGHALQLANQKDEAVKVFTDAGVLWNNLLASRPQSEEYREGLSWCRQRLDDLK